MKNFKVNNPDSFTDFVGTSAHEINNFLSAINGFTELTLLDMEDGNPNRPYLKEILNSVDHTQIFSQKLLALVGRISLTNEAMSTDDLLQMISETSGIQPSLIQNVNAVIVLVDKQWTKIAINELSVFSRFYGNEVNINLKINAEKFVIQWVINIKDKKIDMTKLFEPYYSSRTLFSTKGLGLSWLPGFFYRQQGSISATLTHSDLLQFELAFSIIDAC